jgi:spermidine synthase
VGEEGVQRQDFVPRPGSWRTEGGLAELLADADRPGAYLLVVDDVAQSYVDLLEPTHLEFGYIRLLAALVACLRPGPPAPVDLVHVGGGAATLARQVAATRPGSRQQVVEFDAALAAGIEQRLGVDGFEFVLGDGRARLAQVPPARTDGVITDAFIGSRIPAHLTTEEYLDEVRRVLRPGGWFAINVADSGSLDYARRVAATVLHRFDDALLLADPAVLRGRRFGNLLIAGSDAELPRAQLARVAAGDAAEPARLVAGEPLRQLVADARPLRDDDAVASPVPPEGTFTVR